jgi:hypothetical protein
MKKIFLVPFREPIAQPKAIFDVCLSFQRPSDHMKWFQTFALTIIKHCHMRNSLATTLKNFLGDLSMAFSLLVARLSDNVSAFLGKLLRTTFAELS